ncbi:hypothetical protein G9A89_004527 [Geosiphon pyriformis]|nr:hypothetical protein G9A89_004527 [Geosiphon pyriformis]
MVLAKIKEALPEEIKIIKNNPSEPIKLDWCPNSNIVLDPIDPEQFHKYYQELAPIRKEQKQHLEQLNTRLYQHCLIFYDFQYCNKCDFIYNLSSHIIYTIPEEKEPISSCASESKSMFNPDSNFDNNDNNNNGFSSVQYDNQNNNDSNSNSNPKQYITLLDLFKEQKLKWFSNNNKDIMPKCMYNTNTEEPALTNKSTVAELESIGANHLGFVKSLFQHYCQHLRLNHNQISAESVFNFYINKKIAYLLGTPVNTKSAKETFYYKLIQNTSLPTNYNFTSIITEINKEIEHHTQQRYPITYVSKDKEKLQTLAKHKIESPTNPSYHYTPGSVINIASADTSTLNTTSTFE